MSGNAESVLAAALRLDARSRAGIAAELLASLDGPADPGAAEAWEAEISRRIDSLESGRESLESWADTRARIERELLGR